jgi:hypothetical protein
MVEKVKALCDAIDTLNSLPTDENTDARLAELSEMLLAECKQMVQKPVKQALPPTSERVYEAGNRIEPGDPLLIVGDKVYSTRKSVQVEWQGPASPESNEGFHTLVPPTPSRQDIARATLLREMGEINESVPSGQKIYPDLGLPRLP